MLKVNQERVLYFLYGLMLTDTTFHPRGTLYHGPFTPQIPQRSYSSLDLNTSGSFPPAIIFISFLAPQAAILCLRGLCLRFLKDCCCSEDSAQHPHPSHEIIVMVNTTYGPLLCAGHCSLCFAYISHLIFKRTFGWCYYYLHLTDKKCAAQRSSLPKPHS